jgi:hypothetical protein
MPFVKHVMLHNRTKIEISSFVEATCKLKIFVIFAKDKAALYKRKFISFSISNYTELIPIKTISKHKASFFFNNLSAAQ